MDSWCGVSGWEGGRRFAGLEGNGGYFAVAWSLERLGEEGKDWLGWNLILFWLHESSNDASRSDSVVVSKPVKFTELRALDLNRSLHEAMGSMAASSLSCKNATILHQKMRSDNQHFR